MSRTSYTFRRAGLAALALALSAALPASAQQAAQEAAQESSPQAAPAAESLTVTRDPVTGQLRPATAAEQAALRAATQARARIRAAAPRVQQKIHASGARGARLNDDLLTSSIAVRGADGSIQVAHGTEEAAALVRAREQARSAGHIVPNPVTE